MSSSASSSKLDRTHEVLKSSSESKDDIESGPLNIETENEKELEAADEDSESTDEKDQVVDKEEASQEDNDDVSHAEDGSISEDTFQDKSTRISKKDDTIDDVIDTRDEMGSEKADHPREAGPSERVDHIKEEPSLDTTGSPKGHISSDEAAHLEGGDVSDDADEHRKIVPLNLKGSSSSEEREETPSQAQLSSIQSEPVKTPRTPMGPSSPAVPSLVQGRGRRSTVDEEEADDMVLATFIVRFDTLHGNVVEWTCPENIDLAGLEFAALPSGLHLVDRDCVYFSKNTYYGVSIFENYALGDDPAAAAERGARMAAAGILTPRYPRLHRHVEFLREAISYHAIDPVITQQLLTQYYHQHRQPDEGPHRRSSLQSPPSQLLSIPRVRRLHAHHPARHFGRLLEQLGPSVFSLWKYALLSKRILFSSTPPLEPLGNYVYSTCLMAAVASDLVDKPYPPEVVSPLFCVGINDVMRLSVLDHYVACTSDRVLKEKGELYDVLIHPRIIPRQGDTPPQEVLEIYPSESCSPEVSAMLRPNAADRRRFSELAEQFSGIDFQKNWWERVEAWWQSRPDISGVMESVVGSVRNSGTEQEQRKGLLSEGAGEENHDRLEEEEEDGKGREKSPEGSLKTQSESLKSQVGSDTPKASGPILEKIYDEDEEEHVEQVPRKTKALTVGEEEADMNVELLSYFQALNTTLLRHLRFLLTDLPVSGDGTTHLEEEHLVELGLHPRDDSGFVEALVDMYFPEYGAVRIHHPQRITDKVRNTWTEVSKGMRKGGVLSGTSQATGATYSEDEEEDGLLIGAGGAGWDREDEGDEEEGKMNKR
ncbi:hypothetical protein BJ684DRAFT_17379 [Piptocephalis cylindrospora]|uniref:UDENN domain-containing protein n=1 Tax=Piptocephalis cylindrospora TaxID=1907219 RepID=A0A4V1IXS7_9FUNG|nr:hypothetical protein BJ684DRAFT_17379 [Piptocephalis cylindrospora]|eukprot:RKP12099.1 hypothetical protein BJ684DRAFT_17379 [Piptocephalis cylindrospora]